MPRGLVLESSIQASVVKYARQRGLLAKKLSVQGPMGTSGWPDYMFLGLLDFDPIAFKAPGKTNTVFARYLTRRKVFFIEFKSPGGKLTPLQQGIKEQIEHLEFAYYVVDNTEQGRKVIDDELR